MRRRFREADLAAWFLKHDGVCHICGGKILAGQKWEKEHVIPLAQGGEDTLDNLRPAHARPCHQKKTAEDATATARAKRREARRLGIKKPRTITSWRRFDGSIVKAGRER